MSRRNRASLRGKGWKIFFGKDAPEHAESAETRPPGHIDLTPDETEDLLSAVPAPLGLRDTSELEPVDDLVDPYSTIEVEVPDGEDFMEARHVDEAEPEDASPIVPAMMATIDSSEQRSVVSKLGQKNLGPEGTLGEMYDGDSFSNEAVPIVESSLSTPVGLDLTNEKIAAHADVEALTPRQPETLDDDDERTERKALAKLGASKAAEIPDFAPRIVKESDLDLQKSDDVDGPFEEDAKG